MSRETLFIQAPSKINLTLSVGPVESSPDGNGLHPIHSWMIAVNLYDDLTITRLEPDYFSRYAIIWQPQAKCKTDIDWSITTDLAVRAHMLLERELNQKLPVQLKLEKRIPVGAGLGGGSSDAAAMLIGCNRLFDLGLSGDDLINLSATLGSDIAFFLSESTSSIVEEFGNRIENAPPPTEMHLVLVMGSHPCPTAEVYRAFDQLRDNESIRTQFESNILTGIQLTESSSIRPDEPFNDLTPAAFSCQPDLIHFRDLIENQSERSAHLTGSGGAMFVLCDDPLHAQFLAAAIEKRHNLAAWPIRLHEPAND